MSNQCRFVFLAPLILLCLPHSLLAQDPTLSISCAIPPQLELLDNPAQLRDLGIISAYPLEPTQSPYPNLWWAKEQFDTFEVNLIDNWLMYPQQQQIDLIVNRQVWLALGYLDHYRLVNQFGTVARTYGYNLRIFNQRQQCLAIYSCNFATTPPQCTVDLKDSFGL